MQKWAAYLTFVPILVVQTFPDVEAIPKAKPHAQKGQYGAVSDLKGLILPLGWSSALCQKADQGTCPPAYNDDPDDWPTICSAHQHSQQKRSVDIQLAHLNLAATFPADMQLWTKQHNNRSPSRMPRAHHATKGPVVAQPYLSRSAISIYFGGAAVNFQKVFNPEQIGRIWRKPLSRKAILFAAPIVVLIAVSYSFDPSEKVMLVLCLLYSVFIVPKATEGVITKLMHVYTLTLVTFPFIATIEYFQSGDTLMIGYGSVFAVLNYEHGKRKWMDDLAAATRSTRKRDQ
ncbi:hypothetical protein [Rhizobium sp. Rhizsp82]|uniref:hypothetical protein n=1 Tax=Rhizobium sp. Rhizsp82 TaxID=3243057 RepID=UPI0039B6B97F